MTVLYKEKAKRLKLFQLPLRAPVMVICPNKTTGYILKTLRQPLVAWYMVWAYVKTQMTVGLCYNRA